MKNNPRKQQILKAAQKRFARHGLNKTSVEEIARDLRVGKATIYHYFESKEEIFYVVLQMEIDRFSEELKSIFSDNDTLFNTKLNTVLELKGHLPEKFGLIYELLNIMLRQEPLQKEIDLFNNMLTSEKIIVTDYLRSTFGKKQIDPDLIDFIVLQSWGIVVVARLYQNKEGEALINSGMLSKLIEQRLS